MNVDDNKLSESEKLTIIDMARYAITRNSNNRKLITAAEAKEINQKMPDVRIRYNGPRRGRMVISWIMESKTVNFIYSGEFLTDSAMWQLGIARHDYKVSKEKVKSFTKHSKVKASDFDDLRFNGNSKVRRK
jgi:hypothetical protein